MGDAPGAVATPHFTASQAAADVLRSGGNAVDAALTAAAVLTVVYPHQCTVAGDAVAIVGRDGHDPCVINGSGPAPAVLNKELFTRPSMPVTGPDTVTVPGALAAWDAMASRWGTRPLASALTTAADIASDGCSVSAGLARDLRAEASTLCRDEGARKLFMRNGEPLSEGMTLRQPLAARSLQRLAQDGIGAMYGGELGAAIVGGLQRMGGSMQLADLAEYQVEIGEAAGVTFQGDDYFSSTGNTQGGYFLAALAALEVVVASIGRVPNPLGRDAACIARVLQQCCRTRDEHLGDTHDAEDRVRELWTHAAASAFAQRGLRGTADTAASPSGGHGASNRRSGDTVAITVADGKGTWVTVIQSAFYAFGSGIVDQSTGFVLHNRGAAFSLNPHSPNALRARRRPFHTLMPVLVRRGAEFHGAHGTMGGRVQPHIHTHLALNVARGDDCETAVGRPRWIIGRMEHGVGLPDGEHDISMESNAGDEAREALTDARFDVHPLSERSDEVGHAQLVRRTLGHGLTAATDPRADGAAIVASA